MGGIVRGSASAAATALYSRGPSMRTAAGWTYHALGRAAAASALPRKDSHS